MKKKWLVISNCQTEGLRNSLSLFCPQAEVDACDIWRFQLEADLWREKVAEYDQLIVHPEIQGLGIVDFANYAQKVSWVPGFLFRGFHPDLSYAFLDGSSIQGPMNDYHSAIVVAAFKQGLTETEAARLFTRSFYEKIGFFSIWESEKQTLLASFNQFGINIGDDFIRWLRAGSFMHSINHPRITAVHDVAEKVARKLEGQGAVQTGIVPHDNLMAGPIYPIYPEIAERYGTGTGSYSFKPMGSYSVLNLDEFIAGSYNAYRKVDCNKINVANPHHDVAMKIISEAK